jgi:hypothetical protein
VFRSDIDPAAAAAVIVTMFKGVELPRRRDAIFRSAFTLRRPSARGHVHGGRGGSEPSLCKGSAISG